MGCFCSHIGKPKVELFTSSTIANVDNIEQAQREVVSSDSEEILMTNIAEMEMKMESIYSTLGEVYIIVVKIEFQSSLVSQNVFLGRAKIILIP